jgi:glycerol-3-phosphate dehydrogenase
MNYSDQKNSTVIANPFSRSANLNLATVKDKVWDIIIIGGGATGLGTAIDAANRGLSTLLLEQADFAKGTSSRATKLVHGGVRYLAQGDIALVREALRERGLLLKNAPHLVKNQSFIIPNYSWWDGVFYTVGLTMYDLLAGKLSLGRAAHISKQAVLKRLPTIQDEHLHGGVVYHDGQFDDARLAVNLAQTAIEQGAAVLNYVKVVNLLKDADDRVAGVNAVDTETNIAYTFKARTVVNATGIFVDEVMRMDAPEKKPMVRPSQGVHLVLDASFMPAEDALMIPKTSDGRVLFAVPWHGKLLVGTTDTLVEQFNMEPVALETEIQFILETAGQYLKKAPTRQDVLSVFAGLRPLAAPQNGSSKTKEISRSHKIIISPTGLITITGGKWTTYRQMGQDVVDMAVKTVKLKAGTSKTANLAIHGSLPHPDYNTHWYVYGADRPLIDILIKENPDWAQRVHPDDEYTKAEVIWSVRNEMARTVEDILARRVRVLFLNARLAIKMAPLVAELMAGQLDKDIEWQQQQIEAFNDLAKKYVLT